MEEKKGTLTYPPEREHIKKDSLLFFPGESFGARYLIIEEIGRGGMGRVYKAEDRELGIIVALKMIRPEYSSNSQFIKRFKRETVLARSISHENMVRIHDLGEVEKIKFISMDYIKGNNLKELIKISRTLAVDTAISITKQICEGLRVAHQKGIVHRDLKPSNIMIDNSGKVYITDLGLAKSTQTQEDSLSRGIVGTPQYLSPEQAKGEKVDQRSDIYSLGIIIYEMLTGKHPFEAETVAGYIQKHIHQNPPSPSKINPLIPPFLEKIILKCLEKDKEKRYQNVEEILGELERKKVETRVFVPQAKLNKLLRYGYIIPLIIIIVIGIYFLRGRKKPVPPPLSGEERASVAVMYFENSTGDRGLDYWRKALSDSIIYDLLQSKYVRVLTTDRLFDILRELNLLEVKTYSSDDLRKIAARGRANYILLGNYTQAEDTFRINAMLKDIIKDKYIASEKLEGKGLGSFFTMVDQLTPWIKSKLNVGPKQIAADIDKDIGKIITSSPEALRNYIQGKEYYRDGKFKKSNEALEKAVTIDPGFALAYKQMSENYHYLGYVDQAKKYMQKALSLIDRVSERERYLIQGFAYTILETSYEKAINIYKELLRYYPDDEEGNSYLGAIYRNLEEWNLAFERFSKILKNNPKIAYDNLPNIYMAKGLYKKALEFMQVNRDAFNPAQYHWHMSLIYLCQGSYNFALQEAENALSLKPDSYDNIELMGNIYHLQNNFKRAEEIYHRFLERDDLDSQLNGHFWLSRLYLAQGQYKKSKDEIIQNINLSRKLGTKPSQSSSLLFLAYLNLSLKNFKESLKASDEAAKISSEINFTAYEKQALHFRGLAYLKMNEIDEAQKAADQLKQLIEKIGNKKDMKHYFHLMGKISQEKGMYSDAINDFNKALSLLSHQKDIVNEHAFYLEALASAYNKLGDLEKARDHFEKIVSLTTGRLQWGDIYATSFYWLGKIYQEKGWVGKAIENYKKFLQLWVNADPNLPETVDAREQLAVLSQASHK